VNGKPATRPPGLDAPGGILQRGDEIWFTAQSNHQNGTLAINDILSKNMEPIQIKNLHVLGAFTGEVGLDKGIHIVTHTEGGVETPGTASVVGGKISGPGDLAITGSTTKTSAFSWTGGKLTSSTGANLVIGNNATLSMTGPRLNGQDFLTLDGRNLIVNAGATASLTSGQMAVFGGPTVVLVQPDLEESSRRVSE